MAEVGLTHEAPIERHTNGEWKLGAATRFQAGNRAAVGPRRTFLGKYIRHETDNGKELADYALEQLRARNKYSMEALHWLSDHGGWPSGEDDQAEPLERVRMAFAKAAIDYPEMLLEAAAALTAAKEKPSETSTLPDARQLRANDGQRDP